MNEQKPSIGRIVHFGAKDTVSDVPYEKAELLACAAIITAVHEDNKVHLHVFSHSGAAGPASFIPYSPTLKEGHWSWPPRV